VSTLHIGIDLDNTIIDYSDAFALVGVETGLLLADHGLATKEAVKDYLRAGSGGEEAWMRLQGQVYGRCIGMARMFEGADSFLKAMREHGARVSIVSHKTRLGHFDPEAISLWDAARGWLTARGCFAANVHAINPDDLHFLETRAEKIGRIATIGCDVFVDDLPEVLNHPSFPPSVTKLWFASTQPSESGEGLKPHRSWGELRAVVEALF